MGQVPGSKSIPSLAEALEQCDKADTAVRLALARELKEGVTDPELVRRAAIIVAR